MRESASGSWAKISSLGQPGKTLGLGAAGSKRIKKVLGVAQPMLTNQEAWTPSLRNWSWNSRVFLFCWESVTLSVFIGYKTMKNRLISFQSIWIYQVTWTPRSMESTMGIMNAFLLGVSERKEWDCRSIDRNEIVNTWTVMWADTLRERKRETAWKHVSDRFRPWKTIYLCEWHRP